MQDLKYELHRLTIAELTTIATQFGVPLSDKKRVLIENIYNQYTDVKKYIPYTYIRQLGREGKDGRTFLAYLDDGQEVAIKIFRKSKSSYKIEREAKLQMIAANKGIAPKVIHYDGEGKFIVMEKLDENLFDLFCEQNGTLTTAQQKSVIRLFRKLDECSVFHGDPNPLNFMMKNGKWYIIDFGFAKSMNRNTIIRYGETPNMRYMPMGFKLKIEKMNPDCKLNYIDQFCVQYNKQE